MDEGGNSFLAIKPGGNAKGNVYHNSSNVSNRVKLLRIKIFKIDFLFRFRWNHNLPHLHNSRNVP